MNSRYTRQCMLEGFDNIELLASRQVSIIGLGGLGGLCAYLLAGSGVKNLKIADFDTIELSNLHRQILYRQNNIGQNKAQIAKEQIMQLDDSCNIQCFGKIDEDNFCEFTKDSDLILDLSDNVQTRLLINQLCFKYKLDYIHVSVANFTGIAIEFNFSDPNFVKNYGCYECLTGQLSPIKAQGILGSSASFMSSVATTMALEYLTYVKREKGIVRVFDLKDFAIRKFKLIRDCNCKVCNKE